MKSSSIQASILLGCLLAGPLGCMALGSGAQNAAKIRQDLAKLGPCMIESTYSNIYPEAYPPTTVDELSSSCKAQTEKFKCIKDELKTGSKNLPVIVKRGLQTFVQIRQRHNKKHCTDVNSEASRQFLRSNKCIRDKKFSKYNAIDSKYANTILAIRERNFNDSAVELKYFCCAALGYRKAFVDNVGPECEAHKPTVEEMIASMIPNDVNLLCDDDDQKFISKICPNLEPLKVATKFVSKPDNEPLLMTLYLVATLGEPEV